MKQAVIRYLLIGLGWFFVLLGVIGAFLPLLPTTVFLILAAFFFARSSPRFHQMLLNNRYFGPGLQQWERDRSVTRETKRRATTLIILAFSISIAVLYQRIALQIMLVCIACILLVYIWRLREQPAEESQE